MGTKNGSKRRRSQSSSSPLSLMRPLSFPKKKMNNATLNRWLVPSSPAVEPKFVTTATNSAASSVREHPMPPTATKERTDSSDGWKSQPLGSSKESLLLFFDCEDDDDDDLKAVIRTNDGSVDMKWNSYSSTKKNGNDNNNNNSILTDPSHAKRAAVERSSPKRLISSTTASTTPKRQIASTASSPKDMELASRRRTSEDSSSRSSIDTSTRGGGRPKTVQSTLDSFFGSNRSNHQPSSSLPTSDVKPTTIVKKERRAPHLFPPKPEDVIVLDDDSVSDRRDDGGNDTSFLAADNNVALKTDTKYSAISGSVPPMDTREILVTANQRFDLLNNRSQPRYQKTSQTNSNTIDLLDDDSDIDDNVDDSIPIVHSLKSNGDINEDQQRGGRKRLFEETTKVSVDGSSWSAGTLVATLPGTTLEAKKDCARKVHVDPFGKEPSYHSTSNTIADAATMTMEAGDHLWQQSLSTIKEPNYTLDDFIQMWEKAAENQGITTTQLEHSRAVRGANTRVATEDSSGQAKAQYGRIEHHATMKLLEKYLLTGASPSQDVVVDIGSGIGNVVLQAALVFQCEARGIELDNGRYSISQHCYDDDMQQQRQVHLERDSINYVVGTTKFMHGRLEDPEHCAFLTQPTSPNGTIRAFCNNFNGVFAYRSSNSNQAYELDAYIAGLFALMPPGSVLVTLYPLPMYFPRSKVLEMRRKHKFRTTHEKNASFYEMKEFVLGAEKKVVNWSNNDRPLYIYKYVRLQQNTENGLAVFQCCNQACKIAQEGRCIPVTKTVPMFYKGKIEHRIVINTCECGYELKPDRNLKKRRQQSREASGGKGKYQDPDTDDEFS